MVAKIEGWICNYFRMMRTIVFFIPAVMVPLWLGPTIWSALSVIGGFLLFGLFMWRYQPRHFEPAWQQLADQLQLRFVPRTADSVAFVEGEINGRYLKLYPQNPLPKWNQPSQTILQVNIKNPQGHEFTFYNPSKREQDTRMANNIQSAIGVPKIDAHFVFMHHTDLPFAQIFSDPFATQLARIAPSTTHQRIRLEGDALTYEANGILINPNSLRFVIELMVELGERVETAVDS